MIMSNAQSKPILKKRKNTDLLLNKSQYLNQSIEDFVRTLNNNLGANELIELLKKLEQIDPEKLKLVLDQSVLNRQRTKESFLFDSYCLAIYEKYLEYEKALQIAEELLAVNWEADKIRAIFRICRKLDNYEKADFIIKKYPQIFQENKFPILYELVYYYEHSNDFDQVKNILDRIEKQFADSIPIQKTLKNFYLRFEMFENASKVEQKIDNLSTKPRNPKNLQKYSVELEESQIFNPEWYQDLDHKLKLAAISDLTHGISHELGQPITNIRYTLQFYRKMFETNLSKKAVFKVFDSILEETQRMGELIKRLAPITSTKSMIENFDIVENIKQRVNAHNLRLKEANINVNIKPSNNTVFLEFDRIKFEQIINNLLLNSIDGILEAIQNKILKEQPQINIEIKENCGIISITFADNGCGITLKDRGKVFDPFFTTKPPGKGQGLGLFIIWNLLKIYNGTISLDHQYEKGTRFSITIPQKFSK